MSIGTDGSGTVMGGERERYVVEFVDPGKRTAAAVNLAGLGLDESAQPETIRTPSCNGRPQLHRLIAAVLLIYRILMMTCALRCC